MSSFIGHEFAPKSGFLDNVWMPRVFPMWVSINAIEAFQLGLDKQQMRRHLDNEEIRRKIFVGEMGLAR